VWESTDSLSHNARTNTPPKNATLVDVFEVMPATVPKPGMFTMYSSFGKSDRDRLGAAAATTAAAPSTTTTNIALGLIASCSFRSCVSLRLLQSKLFPCELALRRGQDRFACSPHAVIWTDGQVGLAWPATRKKGTCLGMDHTLLHSTTAGFLLSQNHSARQTHQTHFSSETEVDV
jgi:hypothetical protein